LLWHYPVILLSIVVHEIGHAMPCRHYKVRLTDFGAAIYVLLATGWARPLQADWAMLTRQQKMVAIVMGPWASLLFAAVGVWVWSYGEGWLHTLGVVMAVSSTLALIPTLLPMFNGDTYLAICELSGEPRLRQRAFHYARRWLGRGQDESHASSQASRVVDSHECAEGLRKTRIWFFLILALTVLGWVLVWAVVGSLVYRVLFSLFNF
jgi:putative peptide zinc metalloprotease protein